MKYILQFGLKKSSELTWEPWTLNVFYLPDLFLFDVNGFTLGFVSLIVFQTI